MSNDNRNWFQKFLDQCSFGPQYTIYLSPEEANKALDIFRSYAEKDRRTKDLIKTLSNALNSPTTVNGQDVITVTLDTSDTLRLRDAIGITKENIHSKIEDGLVRTETTYPKQ